MLVGFPIGLWGFALVCDVVHAVSATAIWQTIATYCVAGGIVSAILAAMPGLIDYFSINETEMKRIANLHLAVNLGAAVIFAINLWLRFHLPKESNLPMGLSVVGVLAIALAVGWAAKWSMSRESRSRQSRSYPKRSRNHRAAGPLDVGGSPPGLVDDIFSDNAV